MSGRALSVAIVLVMVLPAFSAMGYETLMVPTEVRHIERSLTYDGYTLFPSRGTTYLVDMEGRVVHTWERGSNPKLLDNGNILDRGTYNILNGPGFEEVDWNSFVVWKYAETRKDYNPHHDFNRIFNPKLNQYTTIYIAAKNITSDQALAAGCDPANGPYNGAQVDAIVEVDMNGTVVWEWCFFDHVIQDIAPAKANYVGAGRKISDYPGKLNINLPGKPLRADWLHCNALDYNEALDQVVIDCLNGELYVIDHGQTFIPGDPQGSIALAASTAGDFLYRFGDPARYGRGEPPSILEDWTMSKNGDKQLGGSHDVQWIDEGLPGAGHFLVFNNAQYMYEKAPQSYVVEIDPYLDSEGRDTGDYVDPPAAGYHLQEARDPDNSSKQDRRISNQVVWDFGTRSNQDLFDQIGCGVQRLPNGNTLICSCAHGRILEVTAGGDIAWEYVNPDNIYGVTRVRTDTQPMVSSMFRAYRLGPDHPALAGRTLVPGNPITGPATGPDTRPPEGSTETFYLDNSSSFGGYTLFPAYGTTYLIDMEGRLIHTWATGLNPRLLDNGTLLDAASTDLSDLREIQMMDWDGNLLWSYAEARPGYLMHHDFCLAREDGTGGFSLMYLASKPVSPGEALAAGCDPADGPYDDARTDGVVEVDPNGTVVWEWWFFDHGVQEIDQGKDNYVGSGKNISSYPGRIDLNLPGRPLGKSWLDCNSIDYNPGLDQLVVNSELGEFYVIDHGATFVLDDPAGSKAMAAGPAGDFIYRFGDPARYGQGAHPSINADWTVHTLGNKQIGGSNNVHWIDDGLQGAGNLLVFNNAQYLFDRSAQSYVFEVNPFRNSNGVNTGKYVNPPSAGYTLMQMSASSLKLPRQLSKQVVWKYYANLNQGFFSFLGGSAQRLENGNTMVCAMTEGHLFEVTSNGTPVWEYINPVTAEGPKGLLYDRYPMTNPVFRALRYGPDAPAIRGHDLSPVGTITGAPAHYMTPADLGPVSLPPSIKGTAHTPARPTPSDAVAVATTVERRSGLASVALTFRSARPGRGGDESTVFRETMAATPENPWTGGLAENAWFVVSAPPASVVQLASANFGEGNPCGLEFRTGTDDLNGTMVETAGSIDARGSFGYLDFHLWADGLEPGEGWALQLDSGGGYVTRMAELGGENHGWRGYRCELQEGERVATLGLRFQFRAGHADDRVRLDQIYLNVSSGGWVQGDSATVPMFDDGQHGDAMAGDWTFGAFIPAHPAGTRVSYYVTATAGPGLAATDPAGAPASSRAYTVVAGPSPPSVGNLPDTGQTGDYTGTFGEDSDYTANSPAYIRNGDGTVTDVSTGLMWQQSAGGENTWEGAQAYARSLGLGGHRDWRLPSGSELFNIMDFGRADPALDTACFDASPGGRYWTADALAGDGSRVWVVSSGGDIEAIPKDEAASAGGKLWIAARCVRGNVAGLDGGGFTDNGDGTVTSDATGLEWQSADGGSNPAWGTALSYCEGLVLGGHDDWRLPNIKELRSICDKSLSSPSASTAAFPGTTSAGYWSSTTDAGDAARAWFVDFGLGASGSEDKGRGLLVRAVRGGTGGPGSEGLPEMVPVEGGTFVMGDPGGAGSAGPGDRRDERPLHEVTVAGFSMARLEVSNAQYCEFLNSALGRGTVTVDAGGVRSRDGSVFYCDIAPANGSSRIAWDGKRFHVLDGRMDHPVTGVRWEGAAAYCNWLGLREGYAALYDVRTGECQAAAAGYRLPTEAEWEYAALGGGSGMHPLFPWGNDTDPARANGPLSFDPYEQGPLPWTTPGGFFDGSLRLRADLGWPDGRSAYQTGNGQNALGLSDMAGNVWEWVNDWYDGDYYNFSPWVDPAGPAAGALMPDGKGYHALRGGSWSGAEDGFMRISRRASGYDRGPAEPDHPYADVGFRVVLDEARRPGPVAAPGAAVRLLAGTAGPADGPATDAAGNLYFTQPGTSTIHLFTESGGLSVFQNGTGGAAGLAFDADGGLVACEGDARRLALIDVARPSAAPAVLAGFYDGKPFNRPDDLWVDPEGGIYFTDTTKNGSASKDGQHVYYLAPGGGECVRVGGDMASPGGLAGTADGRTLYISDAGAGLTYRYAVQSGGNLSARELFVAMGSEGLTVDASGNVYLANRSVLVFDTKGKRLDELPAPARPNNLEFGGSDRRTLFVTTDEGLCGIRTTMEGSSNFRPGVRINEIKQDFRNGTTGGPGKLVFWVELYNNGSFPADLGGMYLTNNLSRPTAWRIPAGTTVPVGGFLVIWADGGLGEGPLHASFELDAAGGVVALFMRNAVTLVDSLKFGPMAENASFGRYSDGSATTIFMHDHPSPGAANVPDDPPVGGGGGDVEPPLPPAPAVTVEDQTRLYVGIAVIAAVSVAMAGALVISRRRYRRRPGDGGGGQED